jgi:hypothetical protein
MFNLRLIYSLSEYIEENRIGNCRKVFYNIITLARPTNHLTGFKS